MEYVINTPCGKIAGTKCKREGIIAYKGIRYGLAERWAFPMEIISWENTYNAVEYGNCAPQMRAFVNEWEIPGKQFYYNEFRKDVEFTYDEDCLFLNIWVPEHCVWAPALEKYKADKEADKLPVIVYIHGGNFVSGSSNELTFDDPVWGREEVIAVTINYRLGPLGFMCLPEREGDDYISPNLGLFDQLTALSWIKHNIEAFGGDSDNITIMGQSAGAMSVTHLMLSPLAKGYFSKTVMSSGGGLSPFTNPKTPDKKYKFWQAVVDYCKVDTYADFKKVPVELVYEAFDEVSKKFKNSSGMCFPVIDGKFIIDDEDKLVDLEDNLDMPMIMGCNSEDFVAPVFEKMVENYAKRSKCPDSIYEYLFKRFLPGDNYGAFHSADLWYWFGTLDNCWRDFEEVDYEISDYMVKYLTNFAKCGDVNGPQEILEEKPKYITAQSLEEDASEPNNEDQPNSLPEWKPSKGKRRRMTFDDECQMGYTSMVTLYNNVIFHTSP